MKPETTNNTCRTLRKKQGLTASVRERLLNFSLRHLESCPRCRKRAALLDRIELALDLLRTEQRPFDLLKKANTRAVGTLAHGLRETPDAGRLREQMPRPGWLELHTPALDKLLNVAACLFMVLIIKTGVFADLTKLENTGRKAVNNYYARNLSAEGLNDILRDIFPEAETNDIDLV